MIAVLDVRINPLNVFAGRLCLKKSYPEAAMPPDVWKASGLPNGAFKEFWASPSFRGVAPIPCAFTEARSASAHQTAEPHRFGLSFEAR